MTRNVIVAALVFVAPLSGAAQGHTHPQSAATERLGTAHFATSCNPAVSAKFDRAITLLHSFEFGAAITGFNDVLAADSTCAMAHWGIAMSRWSNPMATGSRSASQLKQGKIAADAALRLSDRVTERERGYIRAVGQLYSDHESASQQARTAAYERAMGELAASQPADTEATILHAISLVASASPTDKTYANQRKAGGILEALWIQQPNHPGLAHYIIHSYDYPALAPQASAAARRYAEIAPSAAHALHMPSHTFTRIGLWKQSVETNRRSVEAALRTSSMAEALHASDYAAYAYLQMRNDSAARRILNQLPSIAARFDVNAITGAAPGFAGVFALAAIPARYALERDAWKEAAALKPSPSDFPYTDAMTYFARSIGASRTGDAAKAREAIDSLKSINQRLTAAKEEPYWAEQVAIQHLAASAWLDLAEGRQDSALAHMREAANREDAIEKSAVSPGPLAPAREMLGDMLMELKRPGEALTEYRATLAKEPNRYRATSGAMRAAAASGDRKAESEYRAKLKTLTARAM